MPEIVAWEEAGVGEGAGRQRTRASTYADFPHEGYPRVGFVHLRLSFAVISQAEEAGARQSAPDN